MAHVGAWWQASKQTNKWCWVFESPPHTNTQHRKKGSFLSLLFEEQVMMRKKKVQGYQPFTLSSTTTTTTTTINSESEHLYFFRVIANCKMFIAPIFTVHLYGISCWIGWFNWSFTCLSTCLSTYLTTLSKINIKKSLTEPRKKSIISIVTLAFNQQRKRIFLSSGYEQQLSLPSTTSCAKSVVCSALRKRGVML